MTAPILNDFLASITFAENTVNETPQLIDTDVTLIDPDNDWDGGTLTLTGILAEDTVSVQNVGTGAGQIGLSGADVTFAGVTIGTVAGGTGSDLTITFNNSATTAMVEAVIENLTYANTSDTPTATRNFVLNITDASGADLGGGSTGFINGGRLLGAANPFDGVDVGNRSAPTFVDLDGDGDLDVVIGEYFGALVSFENTGAGFTQLTGAANPFNGVDVGFHAAASFIDLDGDGDLDAVIGNYDGTLLSFENTDAGYTQLIGAANPFNGIDLGRNSIPSFVDFDGDGDLDLVSGERDGELYSFENTGAGFVQLTGTANPFNGVDVGQNSAPSFVDLDGDGDLDAVIGDFDSRLFSYENTGAGFTRVIGAANPIEGIGLGFFANPSFGDVDGDGDLDFVLGEVYGTLGIFENVAPSGQTITVNVTPENEVPLLSGGFTASVIQGLAVTLTTTDLDGADVEDAADSLTFVATDLFGGTLLIDGVSGTSFTRAQLAAGLVVFQHDNSSGDGSFSVSVQDSEGASSAPQTVTVTNSGLNTVNGTEDNDTLTGTEADDVLNGDAGDDTLTGSGGDDLLNGGSGADDLNGGGGFDTASYADDTAGVIFNLDSLTRDGVAKRRVLDGSGSTDTLSLIESAIGSAFDDSLWGNFLRNTLEGGAGNDSLYGRGGNDRLIGGLGDDLLNGASGVDIADYSGASSAVDVDLSVGMADDGDGGMDTLVSIESVIGSAFDDMFVGSALNDTFSGGSGVDDAMGGEGRDTLRGGDDADTLNGEGGNDRLYGDDGADTINGGAGVDVIDGGLGADIINGGADGDRIFGRDGNDTINGDGGIDIINAQEGDDTIFGGDDRDLLRGNDGDDTISGDGGDDRIDGGADTDTVVYAGNQADYNIILRSNGVLSVDDLNLANGDEGYDIITNAEFLQFADGVVDISGL